MADERKSKANIHFPCAKMQDDEDDDPFFMPLPTGAIKLADERKFRMLAEPIGPVLDPGAEPVPMLQMEGGLGLCVCVCGGGRAGLSGLCSCAFRGRCGRAGMLVQVLLHGGPRQ